MYRTTRYFGKNDGKHNLFGELEYIEDWDGHTEEDENGGGKASSPDAADAEEE